MMLMVLPFFLLFGSIGAVTIILLNPSEYLFLILACVTLLWVVISKRVQAFLKTQIALIMATLKIMRGTETQKFEKLKSVRPDNIRKSKLTLDEEKTLSADNIKFRD
jgi:hypothetical protein